MSKPNLRNAKALALFAVWTYACGGSAFNAGGSGGAAGASTTGGSATSGGSSEAGTAAGGASGGASAGNAGTAQGGTDAGGTDAGGTNAGGTNAGGTNAGGTNAGGTNAGGTNAGGTNAGGTGGVRNSGDCLVDKECAVGSTCVALSPGGFRTCVTPVPPPSNCTASDTCCPGVKECAAGATCVAGPLAPSCGLVVSPSPVCAKEACTVLADCSGSNAICVPAGALDRKANTCLTGGCRRDTDCKDIAGGKCEPVTSNCCSGPNGLYCVYPAKGCRSSADCAVGSTCQIVNQKTGECVTGAGICPA
jgi:Dickkopf-like protein